MDRALRVYIALSALVRDRAELLAERCRAAGHDVSLRLLTRGTDESEWRDAVKSNKHALDHANVVVLLLPGSVEAHTDAFYGLGRGCRLVIVDPTTHPVFNGTHHWADVVLDSARDVVDWLESIRRSTSIGSGNPSPSEDAA